MKINPSITVALILAAAFCSARAADITTGLNAYLMLDETSGLTAADSSGNGNNGTLAGFPTDNSEWVTGIANGALNFWFNPAVVTLPDSASLNFDSTAAFTLAAWVNLNIPGYPISPSSGRQNIAGATFFCKGYGTLEQYCLDLYQGALRFVVRDGVGNVVGISTGYYPTNNLWVHLTAVYDGVNQRMELYTNGVLLAAATPGTLPTLLLPNTHPVSIGNRELEYDGSGGYDAPLMAEMDEVRIYGRALALADVQELAATPPCAAPVIVTQPPSVVTTYIGGNVHLAAAIRGCGPMTYQWYFNGAAIAATSGQSMQYDYYYAGTGATGSYYLAVTNAYGGTTSEVATVTLGAEPAASLSDSLIAWWKFDEATGLTAADSSGNGNSVTLYSFPGDDSQWVPGAIGGGMKINPDYTAEGQYVLTDQPLKDSTGNQLLGDLWAFSFWCKGYNSNMTIPPMYPWDTVITPTNATGSYPAWIQWDGGRGVGVFQGGSLLAKVAGTEPEPTKWHHVVVMYDRPNGRYSMWFDGVRKVNRTGGNYPSNIGGYWKPNPSPVTWLIGADMPLGDGNGYSGVLDEMRVYNRWLNLNEVAALYYQGGTNATTLPSMTVTGNGDGTVTVAWPAGATAGGYQLQSSTPPDGPASGWSNVTDTPVPSADGMSSTLTVSATTATFYRLRHP